MRKLFRTRQGRARVCAPDYTASAVGFDAAPTYLNRGTGLTGAADGLTGIFYCFLRKDAIDDASINLFTNSGGRFQFEFTPGNQLQVEISNTSGVDKQILRATTTITAGLNWHSFLASWNEASAGNQHLYVDDSEALSSITDAGENGNLDYTDTDWSIGANTIGISPFNGCISELYFNIATTMDFSVEANRRLFIDNENRPIWIGQDGSGPTGAAPIVYINNPASDFGVNKGTGGDFSVTAGTLTDCTTGPS